MKRNNKGFTLVELLAAIIILGLLAMLGLPTITGMLTSTKDKIYVSDAKRMIAQTEYKIKVNSSSIELPDEGSCIIVGLQYLDASDFDSPPNDGTYMLDQSYTIVKNTGSGLEYSVRLVEKMKKKGYKGVELSTQAALNVDNGLGRVKAFTTSEVTTDMLNSGYDAFSEPIKKNISEHYCNAISEIYDVVDLDDSSVQINNEPPTITSVSVNPTDNSAYNTIKADLVVKADDTDDGRSKLKVCTSLVDFDDAKNHCDNYGNASNKAYTKRYNFATVTPPSSYSPENENPEYTIYVYVKDPSGAYSKKKVTYTVHKNEAPVINLTTTSVTKRPGDPYNSLTAMLTLDVTDDLDNVSDLFVCLDQDDSGSCDGSTNYQKYYDLFGNTNRMEYRLKNVDVLDGSAHSITYYVKDSLGEVTKPAKYIYTLYKADVGSTQDGTAGSHITLTSTPYKNVADNSLLVDVSFRLLDSLGSVTDREVIISERIGSSYIKPLKYTYSAGRTYPYLFGNKGNTTTTEYTYDGKKNRRLDVMVCPKNDYNPDHCNREEVGYDIHKNEAPTVLISRFTNDGYGACPNGYICNGRNSLKVDYLIQVSDDIDYVDDGTNNNNVTNMLQYCISDSLDSCNSNSEFKYFKKNRNAFVSVVRNGSDSMTWSIRGKHLFTPNSSLRPYDGDKRNLFFFVKDTYGEITRVATYDYMLHENKAPYLDDLELIDHGVGNLQVGSKNISLKPLIYSNDYLFSNQSTFVEEFVSDDLTSNKYLAYKLYYVDEQDNEIILAQLTTEQINTYKNNPNVNWNNILTFDKLLNNEFDIDLSDDAFTYNFEPIKYNGTIIKFKLLLTDSYGVTSEYTVDHQLYSNKPPTVDRLDITESDSACDTCGDSGGYNIGISLSAYDDMDSEDDISVCVNEDASVCEYEENFIPYRDNFVDKTFKYTFNGLDGLTPFNGQTKTLHVVVMDSLFDKTFETIDYTVYQNQEPVILSDPIITSADNNYHSSEAIAKVNVSDDLGNLYERVCYYEVDDDGNDIPPMACDGDYKPYNKNFKFNLGISNYQGKRYKIYVNIKDAYDSLVTSNGIIYSTYSDAKPVIDSVTGSYNVSGYNSSTGRVSFKAHDYGDNYKVCITTNSNGSGCSYNSNSYDGSKTSFNDYTYNFGSNSKTATYYMFIKDDHGKVSDGKSFTFGQYSQCSSVDNNIIKYEYVKDPNTTTNKNVISSDACSGRCYYWPEEVSGGKVVKPASDTSKITARYKKTISYRDAYNESQYCNASSEYVNLNCGSVECFNDGSTYNHTAIGLVDYIATEAWTYNSSQGVFSYPIGSHYYKVYTTSYIPGSEYVTLYDTNNRVPIDKISDFKYNCEGSNCTKYYRVLDKNGTTSDYVNNDVAFKYKVTNTHTAGTIKQGDQVKAGTEEFYVVSTDSTTTKLFAKHNLHIGTYDGRMVSMTNLYGLQDMSCVGSKSGYSLPTCYVSIYSSDVNSSSSYPIDLINGVGSICYDEFNVYKEKLEDRRLIVNRVRAITYNEITSLGCRTNGGCANWLTNGSYWLGTVQSRNIMYVINAGSSKINTTRTDITGDYLYGCRPLIEVPTKEIQY